MAKSPHVSNIRGVRVEQCVIVDSAFGDGSDHNPLRMVTEVWSLGGSLIARCDDWRDGQRFDPADYRDRVEKVGG